MDLQTTMLHYGAAWMATTREEILHHLQQCWSAESIYADPITPPARGPEQLADAILSFHEKFPGAQMQPTSQVDAWGTFGRFSWRMVLPEPIVVDGVDYGTEMPGFDFVEFTQDGRQITRVVGFFGLLAPADL